MSLETYHARRKTLRGPLAALALSSLLIAGGAAAASAVPRQPAEEFDFGPIASRIISPDGSSHLSILGPFFETAEWPGGNELVALRPFFAGLREPEGNRSVLEMLWPLATWRRSNNQLIWRVATVMGTDFDTSDPRSRWRLWAMPFLFMGRDAAGRDYAGLFPVIGRIHEILTLDKTEFFLFPLYSRNERDGVETFNLLWPLLAAAKGKGTYKYRVLPFYGRSVIEGKSERTFIMWPIWTFAKYQRPVGSGFGFILFPIFGRNVEDNRKSWMLLPPFIRWTEGPGVREATVPWPFFQIRRGDRRRFYLWPLAGADKEENLSKGFFLWPIVSTLRRELPQETLERIDVMPVLHHEVTWGKKDGGARETAPALSRRLRIWPLMSYRRDGDVSCMKALALWPASDAGGVQRSLEPFWTLYQRSANAGRVESEILWGLVRHSERPERDRTSIFPLVSWTTRKEEDPGSDVSLVLGLLRLSNGDRGRRLRLLYILDIGLTGPRAAGGGD